MYTRADDYSTVRGHGGRPSNDGPTVESIEHLLKSFGMRNDEETAMNRDW